MRHCTSLLTVIVGLTVCFAELHDGFCFFLRVNLTSLTGGFSATTIRDLSARLRGGEIAFGVKNLDPGSKTCPASTPCIVRAIALPSEVSSPLSDMGLLDLEQTVSDVSPLFPGPIVWLSNQG